MRRAARRASTSIVLFLAGACGIPADGKPEALPGGVVSRALPVSAEPAGQPERALPIDIFLVRESHLEPVRRAASTVSVSTAVDRLLQGPTDDELAAGLRSAITPATELRSAKVTGDTAVLDLTGGIVEIRGEEQILAVAQLVLTATTVPGIIRVRFLLDGRDVEVPKPDGTLAGGALSVDDYKVLLLP